MKKLVALSAVTAMLFAALGAQAATQSKLTVSDGDIREISFVNDTTDKASKSIESVLYTLNDLNAKNSSVKQAFEVKSDVEEGSVDVFLRIMAQSLTTTALKDATAMLDTYEIIIKDNTDTVIFDSETDEFEINQLSNSEFALDIYLGRFNEGELSEANTYNLSVKVAADATASDIRKAKSIKWEIVSDPVEISATAVPEIEKATATPVATAAPTAAPTITPAATAAPTAEPTTAPEQTQAPIQTVSSGERVIGDGEGEIKAGKYLAEARDENAIVKIYDKDGELSREIELVKGASGKVITLKDGQKLTYEGGVNLVPYSSTTQTTATAKIPSTKTNPKTGDTAPIAGAAMLAVFALGMLAYPEIEKRKNK